MWLGLAVQARTTQDHVKLAWTASPSHIESRNQQMIRHGLNEILDLLVVGSGPAALVLLHDARAAGLRAVALDKGPLCSALMHHPVYMKWFSTTQNVELCGFPVAAEDKNPTRREYLQYCRHFVKFFGLEVVGYHAVTRITKLDELFHVEARSICGEMFTWTARNVCVATGFYDSPRPLNVPGEELAKVTHRYDEAHPYVGYDVLVVGAGSSAAEVALELWRAGANVTVAMRGIEFHTKYWIKPDIENRIAEGSIACHRNTEVIEILPAEVVLQAKGGESFRIANDFVLAMTGYEPDTTLLTEAGADVDPITKKPKLTPAYESTVPGLYVAGTLIAGVDSNVVFVENSREHGPAIVADVVARR